jgi:hypothetical protein
VRVGPDRAAVIAALLGLAASSGTRGPLVVSLTDAATPDAASADAGPAVPAPGASFQLQLTGALDTSLDVEVYIVDLDDEPDDLSALQAAGRYVVCHFSAGSLEPWRDDAQAIAEDVQGNTLEDYPDERWLDVRAASVRALMSARLDRARGRRCDAVFPANLGVHAADSGLALGEADALDYATWLADQAGARELRTMLGSDELIAPLSDRYDLGLAFGCLAADGCQRWSPLRALGKAVMVVEVGAEAEAAALCPTAAAEGLIAIFKRPEFDAFRLACP